MSGASSPPFRRPFFLAVCLLCCAAALVSGPAVAQQQTPAEEPRDVVPSFPNIPINEILIEYEKWTGKRIIRDASVYSAAITIETSHALTKSEAAVFVEKSLLLNGYALVPSGEDTLKVIAIGGGAKPSSEGLPLFTRIEEVPDNDDVVSFIMPLKHLTPEDASKTFTQVFPPHAYGILSPLSHAQALVITENASVIRKMVELRDEIDVPPSEVENRAIELERADAEEVAEALITLLDLDAPTGGAGTSGSGPTPLQAQQAQARRVVVTPNAIEADSTTTPVAGGEPGVGVQSVQPKIWPIKRSNRILVVARPVDMVYIASLIEHLDAPPDQALVMQRKLNYLPVSSFLPIAQDTLLRGLIPDDAGGGSQISGGDTAPGASGGGGGFQSGGGGGIGNRGGSGSGGGFSSFANNRSSLTLNERDIGPQSVIVDKTLLVADNVQNILIASGPPEHLAIIEDLLDVMDKRPPQIRISAVIAQLTLGDDFEFGVDLLRTLEVTGPDGRKYNGAGVLKGRSGESQAILDIDSLDVVENFLPAAQGLTLYGQINPYLNGYLAALESTNRFKVLSRPTVYTLNNRQAVIFSGQRIAVPRTSTTSLDPDQNVTNQVVTSAIDYEEVLLRIEVLPLINAENEITLRISQINDDIVGSQIVGGNEIPTIGTQALETTVIVPNRSTVLLGGLISEEETKTETGIPIFVSLPWIGKVFGSENESTSRQELMIFIQPEIIDNQADMVRADFDYERRVELSEEALDFALPPVEPASEEPVVEKRHWFSRLFDGLRRE